MDLFWPLRLTFLSQTDWRHLIILIIIWVVSFDCVWIYSSFLLFLAFHACDSDHTYIILWSGVHLNTRKWDGFISRLNQAVVLWTIDFGLGHAGIHFIKVYLCLFLFGAVSEPQLLWQLTFRKVVLLRGILVYWLTTQLLRVIFWVITFLSVGVFVGTFRNMAAADWSKIELVLNFLVSFRISIV